MALTRNVLCVSYVISNFAISVFHLGSCTWRAHIAPIQHAKRLQSALVVCGTHPGPTHCPTNGTVGMESTRQRMRATSRDRLASKTLELREARF